MPPARKEPDPDAGPVERFAYDLRRLREQAGSPDYRSMARRAGCAHSTLSTAASGRRFPTLETTLAFVRVCGAGTEEQARWARRWKQIRTVLDQDRLTHTALSPAPPEAMPPSLSPPVGTLPDNDREVPVLTATWRRTWRWRRGAVAVVAAGAATVAGIGFGTHPAPRAAAHAAVLHSPAATSATTPAGGHLPAAAPAPATPEPERRHGPLVIVPDTVVDLDSLNTDWAVRASPGIAEDDIEFTSDHTLTGLGNADMAVLPAGDVGTFDECALEQDYGVEIPAPAIRPGVLLCDITTQDRVALLRVIDVQHDASGTPDQVTFDVVVWVRLHKS